jgi:rubrerythrin
MCHSQEEMGMALTTFGAIMGFATEITGQAGEVYNTLAQKAKDPGLREVLRVLSTEEGKNHSLMERTRRENVTEMILEPITGLHQEDYGIDLRVVDPMEDADLLRAALILEEREKKFFSDVSIKVPLPEVARIFRKMVQKKQENLTKLQSLALDQTLKRRT